MGKSSESQVAGRNQLMGSTVSGFLKANVERAFEEMSEWT